MFHGLLREWRYLMREKWDLAMVLLAPLLILLLISSMFTEGKPQHLPIALIDQDQGRLSHLVYEQLNHNHGLALVQVTDQVTEAEQLLNQNKIWGYVHIPAGAEQRLVRAQDAEISIAFNQSYFSIGNTISSAMLISTLQAMAAFSGHEFLGNTLPSIEVPTPNIKISPLYNPGLNYEFYLGPYMVPAILHLLLCCCVAFAVGQEMKRNTLGNWISADSMAPPATRQNTPYDRVDVWRALLSKNLCYVLIFCIWTWLWMVWMIDIRGWFVAGSLWMIILGQFLLYAAYALISTVVVLGTHDLTKSFGILAVYGGSSLSFAGVTLPLNNAPLFTQFWANIIPFTPYAKLQTEQWVAGSSMWISMQPLSVLLLYVVIYALLAYLLLRRTCREFPI